MSVLSDRWIKKMALEKEMIKPFVPEQKKGKISFLDSPPFYYSSWELIPQNISK